MKYRILVPLIILGVLVGLAQFFGVGSDDSTQQAQPQQQQQTPASEGIRF